MKESTRILITKAGISFLVIVCLYLINPMRTTEISSAQYNELYSIKKANDKLLSTNESYIELSDLIAKCSEDDVITYNEYQRILELKSSIKEDICRDRFMNSVSEQYNQLYSIKKAKDQLLSTNESYLGLRDLIQKCSEDDVITYNEYQRILELKSSIKEDICRDRFMNSVKEN